MGSLTELITPVKRLRSVRPKLNRAAYLKRNGIAYPTSSIVPVVADNSMEAQLTQTARRPMSKYRRAPSMHDDSDDISE